MNSVTTAELTLIKIKGTEYKNITLKLWTLSSLTFSSTTELLLVDYVAAAVTDLLTITDITINSNSIIKDTTVFDLQGTVNTAWNIDYLKLDTG